MPRLVIDYVKCQGFKKAINVEINGVVSGSINPSSSYDKFIFSGQNELVLICGRTKSEMINFTVGDRETIIFQCQTSGNFSKEIQINKLSQKSNVKRFNAGQNNNNFEADSSSDLAGNWRSILGVRDDASKDTIRKTYIELMKTNHPDKIFQMNKEDRQAAECRAIEINQAYNFAKRLLKL